MKKEYESPYLVISSDVDVDVIRTSINDPNDSNWTKLY